MLVKSVKKRQSGWWLSGNALFFSYLLPCSISVLIIFCFVIKYPKTYWLKTKTTIYHHLGGCRLTGLSWAVLLFHLVLAGAAVIWVFRWAGMLKMTHIMGSWCWMWCGHSARMLTKASQFSSLSPVSKWIGFLTALGLCSEDGALQMCKSKVASTLKARAQKFQVATPTAFCRSRAIVLGLFVFCTWVNIINMFLHITIFMETF